MLVYRTCHTWVSTMSTAVCAKHCIFFLYQFTNLVCIYTIIIYTRRFHGPAVSVDKTLARYIFNVKLEQIRFPEWNRAVVVYRMHIIIYRFIVSKLPRRWVFPYARIITCLMEILILTRTLQRPNKKINKYSSLHFFSILNDRSENK